MTVSARRGQDSAGTYGWLGLAAYITLWDWLAPETLSRAWWKAVEHPRNRWLIVALWGWITAHLFLKRPAKVLYWI